MLGDLLPGVDAVVAALQRRDGVRFHPTGAYAANDDALHIAYRGGDGKRNGILIDLELHPYRERADA